MRARRARSALALAGLAGCAGSALRTDELPDAPIAFYWRDAEAARKHAELVAAQAPRPAPPRPRSREGMAHLDDLAGYARQIAGLESERPSEEETAGRLALLDPRTGARTLVEAALPDAIPVAWTEPRRRLLFSQYEGDFRQLYELDLARGEVRKLTRGPNAHARGCLLPDGSLVASSAGEESTPSGPRVVSRIVRVRPGGLPPEPLSEGPADHSPACAPDGRAVVWVSRDGPRREWLVSRAPLEAPSRRLGPGREPAFSRDGEWVIYAAPASRSWRVWRVRPDGSGRTAVGESALEEHQPGFSPDGRFAVIAVRDGTARRLHVRRLDGSGDRILFDDGGAEFPVW